MLKAAIIANAMSLGGALVEMSHEYSILMTVIAVVNVVCIALFLSMKE